MSIPNDFVFRLGFYSATAIRATEAFYSEEDRIYDARFDYKVLPPFWRGLLIPGVRHVIVALLAKGGMGTHGMLLCRTRFIDDALAAALKKGIRQFVCLGAGFDTRAFRIPGIEATHFFELDLPTAQQIKQKRLAKVLGTVPPHVTFIPIDLNRQNTKEEMQKFGFQMGERTFFIWEGVTQYITAEAVEDTLRFVADTAPGSQIAFTYIRRAILDGTARSAIDQRIMSRVEKRGMPWIFGLDPSEVETFLGQWGLKILDHADANEYRTRYVTPVGRQMDIYAGERMVLAEVLTKR
jgi:methyltransferase (TIGR00027 family)